MKPTLLRVAWLSILLGIGMEALLLVLSVGFGNAPQLKPIVADLVQKISWSFLVCAGLALGTAASTVRAPAMGLLGLMSAPAAFHIARILHKSVAEALAIAGPAGGAASPLPLAMIMGLVRVAWARSWLDGEAALGRRGSARMAWAAHGIGVGVAPACSRSDRPLSRYLLSPWPLAPSMRLCFRWAACWCSMQPGRCGSAETVRRTLPLRLCA